MAADKTIKDLIKHMEGSIESFQKGIPEIQKGVLDSLVSQLKDLQTQDGKILNSVQNLKLINGIKNKLERLIISEGYKDNVKQYIDAFDAVASLQQQYFADFNLKFKPSKTLPIIKEMAIDSTLNDLLGQGLQSNVVDRLHSILQDNVTSGGSYASLNDQLRSTIVGGEDTDGLLQRYSKTITTDAINQYSAQYHEALAMDLNLSWGRYVGSNLTTTREFCDRLTAKEWVHKSELPMIIEGVIDGHKCKLSKSTGLPLGMIPGTNADNFKIRRGGYNCGHQFFWVPDVAVPEDVKNKNLFQKESEQQQPSYDLGVLTNNSLERFGWYMKHSETANQLAKELPHMNKEEIVAIEMYGNTSYRSLNDYLRHANDYKGVTSDFDKQFVSYQENFASLLNKSLDKMPNYEGVVYRGGNFDRITLDNYKAAFEAGKPITEAGFTSTSRVKAQALEGDTFFEIKSKNGKSIEKITEFDSEGASESEVLFKTGSKFKISYIKNENLVDKWTGKKSKKTIIKMEEI